jgi:hypothetical protein
MADADGTHLNLGFPTAPRGRGRPRGSKKETAPAAVGSSLFALVKQRPGRPIGSKNKPKVPRAIQRCLLVTLLLLSRGYIHFSVLPACSAMKFNGCR